MITEKKVIRMHQINVEPHTHTHKHAQTLCSLYNECTKVQNHACVNHVPLKRKLPHARILKVHALLKRTLMTFNGKYTEDFSQKTEKKARCLTSSRIPLDHVVFSLYC